MCDYYFRIHSQFHESSLFSDFKHFMFNKIVELDSTVTLNEKLGINPSDFSLNFKIQVDQLKINIEAKLKKEMKR